MDTNVPRTRRTRTKEASSSGTPRPIKVAMLLLLPVLIAAIVACDSGSGSSSTTPSTGAQSSQPYANSPEGKPPGLTGPVPDPKEVVETKPAGQAPSFLSEADASQRSTIAALYAGAAANFSAFSQVPCYCGCALYTTAHKSLADCFVQAIKGDGSVQYTDHGVSCDLCQQAAQMTLDGIAAKTPLKDVRANIFNKLKYTGIWTDTPPVQ